NNKFFIKSKDDKIYEVHLGEKEKLKFVDRLNQITSVDEYLQSFRVKKSVETYHALIQSLSTPNDPVHLKIDWINRFSFIFLILRAALNSYFIIINFNNVTAIEQRFYRYFAYIISGVEGYLWFIYFVRVLYNIKSIIKRLCINET